MQTLPKELLQKSKGKILVLTGAGISAESGVPTFRGNDGLWKNYRAEDLATSDAFARNPVLVWEWYIWRMELISQKEPNDAHYSLVELEKKHPNFLLITQNVDGLHGKAGSRKMKEIHGNIFRTKCISCKKIADVTSLPFSKIPPTCPDCGQNLRPNVVWFGENYDQTILADCIREAESCDIVIIVGSSGSVGVPVYLAEVAKSSGAFVVEVNPEQSGFSHVAELSLQGTACDTLPDLVKALTEN
ncbi:NAD-dependent protein deacylase [Leptospira perolatii]|uniref:NAD-dependent protein deacylase n=1 Tax=Leptospira perolatii TaxID=2023191 RepID=A0A2M9ZI59_9LEPT|nr:NAD-dependent deacylase [Leptospira perolatii]PJZ68118.1 NAD-dependent protein deacylase [Leptospira perolatii]PJZ71739.1 NAD-dependent protein deacylase [Leptospira perolatii]